MHIMAEDAARMKNVIILYFEPTQKLGNTWHRQYLRV